MKTHVAPIVCEIVAPAAAHAGVLAEVAAACARDVGQPLDVRTLDWSRPHTKNLPATLTLHLPAALASSQHEVWCLACRLACFCPSARVSVLVLGADAFQAAPPSSSASAPTDDDSFAARSA